MNGDSEHARVEAARVDTLYRFATAGYASTLAIAAIVMVVLWGPLTADATLAWSLAVFATTLARVALHWRYVRTDPAVRNPAAWESRFVVGAFASGALWACAAVVFFPSSDPLQQAVLIFVIVGSSLGAIGVYGSSMPAFFAFMVPPLAATIVQLASQPGRSYQMLAMIVLVFSGVAGWVYRGIHASYIEMLRTKLHNEKLSAQLGESESRMRDAIACLPVGIAVYDTDSRLVICNSEYARTYGAGREPAQLEGIDYREIARAVYDAEARPAGAEHGIDHWLEERLQRRLQPGGSVRTYQLRDGRWLQGRFERTRGGGTVSMFTDVSELKRAQESYLGLLAEENLMLDTLPVGVAFLSDRNILRCNPLLERMLGYAPGELAGRPVREIYTSDEHWRMGDKFYDSLAGGGVFEIDAPLRRKDGSRQWVHLQMRAANPESPRESAIFAIMDISARREAERGLKRSEAMYRNLVETSNDLIWAIDREGAWTYLNAAASQRIYGCDPAELLGRPMSERIAPEVLARDLAVFQRVLGGEGVHNYESRHLRRDGVHVDLSFNAIPLRDSRGEAVGATGTARDVSEQKMAAAALHESVEKLRLAADAADLYYWEWDADADTLTWGRNPAGLLGLAEQPASPWLDLRKLVHPDDLERYQAAGQRALESAEGFRCEFRVVAPGGETRWLISEGKLIRGRDGASRRVLGATRDITQAKRQEEEVRFLAYHDTLTGLPNRRLLDDRLKQAVYLAQRRDGRVGVMLVDLDEFKQVNDTLGHRAGDSVLREVSRRLAGCVRKADTLARQGGDEFVIVIPDLGIEADCQVVAEKILRTLQEECIVDGRAFRIGASIGISVFPADAGDGESLLRNADVAMYRAKQLGRNNYRYYSR